eukprot:gnl/MRDRNA2_/MRDRNA2_56250_c0_seq1.p1 gnl/MRDRNA2_/MRDRNA2_56250_c0~~gnl/MRDRNA2_/MRDRNA2_56250_c0_seq1.p1  ORF type:complete len:175 (+),score=24.87 gnl/MRDRNA2_/MRDRNA2_56250_c0_seq1:142-666(+)
MFGASVTVAALLWASRGHGGGPAECSDQTQQSCKGKNIDLAGRHRVGLCWWPIKGACVAGDRRVASIESLADHLIASGYDGVEASCDDVRDRYFAGVKIDDAEIAVQFRRAMEKAGTRVLGSLYIITDGAPLPGRPHDVDFNDPDYLERLRAKFRVDRSMGAEYTTLQVCLPTA